MMLISVSKNFIAVNYYQALVLLSSLPSAVSGADFDFRRARHFDG